MHTFEETLTEMVERVSADLNIEDEQTLLAVKRSLKVIAKWNTYLLVEYMESFVKKMRAVPGGNEYAKGFDSGLNILLNNLKGYTQYKK